MTKKHFIALADIVHKNIYEDEIGRLINPHILIKDLSNYFKTENDLFDEEKFTKACFYGLKAV